MDLYVFSNNADQQKYYFNSPQTVSDFQTQSIHLLPIRF